MYLSFSFEAIYILIYQEQYFKLYVIVLKILSSLIQECIVLKNWMYNFLYYLHLEMYVRLFSQKNFQLLN